MTYEELEAKAQYLEWQNAKLRELVRDYSLYKFGDCESCGYGERCKAHETSCYTVHVNLLRRARELGVTCE